MTCNKDCGHCIHGKKTVVKVICKDTNTTCNRDCYNCRNAITYEYKSECKASKLW